MNNNGLSEDNVFNPYKLESNGNNSDTNNETIKNALGDNIPETNAMNIENNGSLFNAVVTEVADGNSVMGSGMTFTQNEMFNNNQNNQFVMPTNTEFNKEPNSYNNQNLPPLPESKVFIPTNMRNKMNEGMIYSNVNPNGGQNINSSLEMSDKGLVNNDYVEKKKKKKKIIVLIALIVVAIVVIIFIVKSLFFGASKELEMVFDPKQPIPVYNDGLYGYVTHSGDKMIDIKYKSASTFYGKYAVVLEDKETKPYSIIDKSGKSILTSESRPSYISECNVWMLEEGLYSSKLSKITDDKMIIDKYLGNCMFSYVDGSNSGVVYTKGKVRYKKSGVDFSIEISENEYNNKEVYASLETDNGSIIVDLSSGKEVKTFDRVYEALSNGVFYTYGEGYLSNKNYVYFNDGKLAYQIENVSGLSVYDYKKKILEVDYGYDTSPRYQYFNAKKGKVEEDLASDSSRAKDLLDIQKDTYGYIPVEYGDKAGIVKGKKLVVKLEYDAISFPDPDLYTYLKDEKKKNLVLLKKDNDIILYNLKWRTKVETFKDATSAAFDSSSTFIAIKFKNETIKLYNLISKKSLDINPDSLSKIGGNYFVEKKDNNYIYYNTKMEKVFEGVS